VQCERERVLSISFLHLLLLYLSRSLFLVEHVCSLPSFQLFSRCLSLSPSVTQSFFLSLIHTVSVMCAHTSTHLHTHIRTHTHTHTRTHTHSKHHTHTHTHTHTHLIWHILHGVSAHEPCVPNAQRLFRCICPHILCTCIHTRVYIYKYDIHIPMNMYIFVHISKLIHRCV